MYSIDKPFDNIEKITEFCKDCMKEKFISIDTEFVRTKTFFPNLCLIQIANSKYAGIIDVLAVKNLQPLLELLLNEKVIKVFHSPRQDLEIFFNLFKKLPKNIFDTQIGMSFLGEGEQISYEKLVYKYYNIELEKKFQFSDWSKRPLSPEQLNYAISDVTFLRKVYTKLTDELKRKKRLDWAINESLNHLNVEFYNHDPSSYWKKIRFNKSKPFPLNKLKLLTEWREKKCIELNLTRNYVLSDKNIITLLFLTSIKENDIKKIGINSLDKNDLKKITSILNLKDHLVSDIEYHNKKFDKKKIKLLKNILKQVSLKEKISESLIATVSDLKKFLYYKEKDSTILNGWRYEIFGHLLVKNSDGEIDINSIHKQLSK